MYNSFYTHIVDQIYHFLAIYFYLYLYPLNFTYILISLIAHKINPTPHLTLFIGVKESTIERHTYFLGHEEKVNHNWELLSISRLNFKFDNKFDMSDGALQPTLLK